MQERATKISHGHTAFQAKEYGDELLGKICGAVASDESRHEIAYTKIVDELFRLDPSGATLAFADMMRKQIVMPAHLMDDNEHGVANPGRNLFADFSTVAERTGTYTAQDYASIMEHLIQRWDVPNRTGLTPEVCVLCVCVYEYVQVATPMGHNISTTTTTGCRGAGLCVQFAPPYSQAGRACCIPQAKGQACGCHLQLDFQQEAVCVKTDRYCV